MHSAICVANDIIAGKKFWHPTYMQNTSRKRKIKLCTFDKQHGYSLGLIHCLAQSHFEMLV